MSVWMDKESVMKRDGMLPFIFEIVADRCLSELILYLRSY